MKRAIVCVFALLLGAQAFAQPGGGAPGGAGAMPDNATIMANNDGNGDGEITRAEADEAGLPLSQNWDMFDLNSDGKVTDEELTQARGQLGGGGAPAAPAAPAPAADETGEDEED